MSAWFWLAVAAGLFLLLILCARYRAWLLRQIKKVQAFVAMFLSVRYRNDLSRDSNHRLAREKPARGVDENLQFTVYRPKAVAPEIWYPLVAFAHLTSKRADAPPHEPDPVEEVKQQATALLGPRLVEEYRTVTQDASQAVPRGETLTFAPHVPGIEFNPPSRSFRWSESVHREEFRLRAGSDLVGQTARGRLSVFLGDILLADVPLAIPVDVSAVPPATDTRPEVERARPYRRIFASYSHKDLHVVEQFEHLAKVLGDEYLRDWQHLRAGEVWDDRLRELIEEADVFQLFWSRNAMESAYVRREWEHALSLNRPHFVRPTYWEEPLPEDKARGLPPAELLRLHFQRIGQLLRGMPEGVGLPAQLSAVDEIDFDKPSQLLPEVGERRRVPMGPLVPPGYEILRPLSQGGMGTIYVARQARSGRIVVVKMEPAHPDRSLRTEMAGGWLNHPGIVPILEAGQTEDGQRFRVEPYIGGISLEERLRHGPLPAREAATLALQLAEAIDYAHTHGGCHFNLKPSEVLLEGALRPVVQGFVRSSALGEGMIDGTPPYMAPEQVLGCAGEMGARTDVYGLGAVLYECLTGTPPFRGGTAMEVLERVVTESPTPVRYLNPNVPCDLETIVMRCLAKRPEQSYASALELAEDLRRFQFGRLILAYRVSSLSLLVNWMRLHPAAAALVAATMLAGVLLLAGNFYYYNYLTELERTNKELSLQKGNIETELERTNKELSLQKGNIEEQLIRERRTRMVVEVLSLTNAALQKLGELAREPDRRDWRQVMKDILHYVVEVERLCARDDELRQQALAIRAVVDEITGVLAERDDQTNQGQTHLQVLAAQTVASLMTPSLASATTQVLTVKCFQDAFAPQMKRVKILQETQAKILKIQSEIFRHLPTR
jgi:serine/threonine protein kinase